MTERPPLPYAVFIRDGECYSCNKGKASRKGGEEGKEGATTDRKVEGSQISGVGKGARATREKGEPGIQTECRGNIEGGMRGICNN